MRTPATASSNVGLVLLLIGLYLAFVVWMYVSEPVLLAVFTAALAFVWLREAGPRWYRKLAMRSAPTVE